MNTTTYVTSKYNFTVNAELTANQLAWLIRTLKTLYTQTDETTPTSITNDIQDICQILKESCQNATLVTHDLSITA